MDPRFEPLGKLLDELKLLLAALDHARPDDGACIQHAWGRCREAFEEFRTLDCVPGSPHAPYPAEVQGRVSEAMRLHAIALGLTREVQETVRGERRRLAQARAHLDSITGEARTGRSCNVSG